VRPAASGESVQVDSDDPIYREEQRFTQTWLRMLLWTSPLIVIAVIAWAVHESPGQRTMLMLVGLGAVVLDVLLGPGLLHITKLITEVRRDGLYVRFFPFHFSFKWISLDRVKKVEAVRYRPLREYGGWGIRRGSGGRAYNVRGDSGVRLDFGDGSHLLIGSQRADELAAAIRRIRTPSTTRESAPQPV